MSKEEMEKMFTSDSDVKKIIVDPLKFKNQLKIGEDAYAFLSKANNLKSFFEISSTGVAAGGLAAAGWYASLGTLGQIGLTLGMVSTPVGWIAAAGAGGAALTFGAKKLFKKSKEKTMDSIPKFINTPLDVIGINIIELLLPPAIKVALADNEFCQIEKKTIVDYFHKKWGYDCEFIKERIDYFNANANKIDIKKFKERTKELSKSSKEIKYNVIKDEIIKITQDVIESDGAVHENEELMLDYIKNNL